MDPLFAPVSVATFLTSIVNSGTVPISEFRRLRRVIAGDETRRTRDMKPSCPDHASVTLSYDAASGTLFAALATEDAAGLTVVRDAVAALDEEALYAVDSATLRAIRTQSMAQPGDTTARSRENGTTISFPFAIKEVLASLMSFDCEEALGLKKDVLRLLAKRSPATGTTFSKRARLCITSGHGAVIGRLEIQDTIGFLRGLLPALSVGELLGIDERLATFIA